MHNLKLLFLIIICIFLIYYINKIIEQWTYFSDLFNKKLKRYCEVNNFTFVDTFNFFIEGKIINSKYIDGKDHHIKMNDILCINIYKNALSKCIKLNN